MLYFSLNKRPGFTLIELLVVIAIIGILSTLAIVALGSARQKARDSKRLADINQVSKALELYYSDNNLYPTAITPGQSLSFGSTTYMAQVPSNPTPWADGTCPNQNYIYTVDSANRSYSFSACVGNSTNTSPLTNSSIASASPTGTFICGQNISDVDGNSYPTVQIGTQCWMKENLRTGTKISDGVIPANNGVIEKSCSADLDANCVSSGALYQWDEAMQYVTTAGAQGVCPSGWHIPTDSEQNTLDQYLTDSGGTCTYPRTTTSCTNAGTKLKIAGTSGFNFALSGNRGSGGSGYGFFGATGYLWSSTENTTNGIDRIVDAATGVTRATTHTKTYSFGIRCLKN